MMPDLAVGLIRVRDATERSAEEGIPPYVVELTATISNRGGHPRRRDHHALLGAGRRH